MSKYYCPAGETIRGANFSKSKYLGCNLDDEDDWHHFRKGISFVSPIFLPLTLGKILNKVNIFFTLIRITKPFEPRYEKRQHLP